MTVQEKLTKIDQRLVEARRQHREVQLARQEAIRKANEADEALMNAEARFAAGQITEKELGKARQVAAGAQDDADWNRRVEVAARTVTVVEQERAQMIADNLSVFEAEIQKRQADLDREAEAHVESAGACIAELHRLNAERTDLRRAVGMHDTRDLPNWQRWEPTRQFLRKQAQAAA
jgi:hypothetical protein